MSIEQKNIEVSTGRKKPIELDESRIQRDVTGDVPSVDELVPTRKGWRISTVADNDRIILDATNNQGVILCRPASAFPTGMPPHLAEGDAGDPEYVAARIKAGYDLITDESLLSVSQRGFLMLGGVLIGAINLAWLERREEQLREARKKRAAERAGRDGATFQSERHKDGDW